MKNEVVKKKSGSFTLLVDLVETIKELAEKEKKSGSKVVEELIRESLKNRKRSELEKIAISSKNLKFLKGMVSLGRNALKDSNLFL